MARVALIATYPYESVWGGDAVYLDRIRTFLASRGHRVDSYVTNLTRGRSNPTVRLRSGARQNHRWHVRRAVALGNERYLSLDPRLLGRAVRRLPGGRAPAEHHVDEAEARWVVEAMREARPDLAILAFGACAFTRQVRATGTQVLALKGFFSDRTIRIGEQPPMPFVSPDLLDALGHATCTGFNNRYDLNLYHQLSGRGDAVLVGMGFPRQIQPPPQGGPNLLFVGARTKPNVASLEWFLEQVWPTVRARIPDTTLRVAGSAGTALAGRTTSGVTLLGFVDDLAAEYRNAGAVIAPLVSGTSGVKTKIAEALSFGRPVITTSLGVDPGCPDQYGDAVIVADDPGSFAAAVLHMLDDMAHRRDRLADCVEQFDRHFAEDSAYREITLLLESGMGERRAAAP